MEKDVIKAKLRVYKKHMACAEVEVSFYRDEIARLEALLQEGNLEPRAADDCPQCDICNTVTVQMDGGYYACPSCGNRQ